MIKVHESLLKIIEEKAYHNNIEFTGIGYSSVYRTGLSNSVEYGYIEKEFIDGFETGFYTHYYPEHRICMRYTIDKSSLSKSNFIGKFETFYIDGQICEIGEFVNNKLHGNYECFYEDGRQFITATFNKDSFTGYGKSYYRNGVICEEGTITDVPNFTKNLELRLYYGVTPTKIDGIFMDYNIPYSDHFLNELMYSEQCDDFRLNSNYKVRGDYKAYNVEGKIIAWIKDSIKQTFDIKGQRLFVGAYNEFGQEHGQIIKYNYGHIQRIESYINGKLDGIFLEFNYEGFLKSKGEYLNGSKAGNWINYYENGLMKSETKYLNSSQYSYIIYHNNQKILKEGQVVNGKNDGPYRCFHNNGSLHHEKTYHNDIIMDREIKFFYDNGNLQGILNFENGKLEGFSFAYFKNGKLKTKCYYHQGNHAGLFEHYYETGFLKVKCNLIGGLNEITQDFVFFNEDGKRIKKPDGLTIHNNIFSLDYEINVFPL